MTSSSQATTTTTQDVSSRADEWKPRARIFLVIKLLNGRVGGAERLFCDMANLLAEAGYAITILHCDSRKGAPFYPLSNNVSRINVWGKSSRTAPWYKLLDTIGRRYDSSKKNPILAPFDWLSKNLYFTRRIHAAAKLAKPDVLISFMPPANTPTLLAGWLSATKVVPTNHSVPVHDYQSDVRWDQNPIDKRLRFWSLRTAERVHVLFPAFAEWFPDNVQNKTVAIPNFLSPEFDHVPEPDKRNKVIIAAGRLADIKNYPTLLQAWSQIAAKHPDWKVKIYGDGPRRAALQAEIRQLGISDSVFLVGHESDMKGAYVDAEILCHPALFEGFGLAAAEGLACGLPVVAFSDCAGLAQFVVDGENGLMIDRSGGPAALADALERLIDDEALRHEMRSRAPDSVRKFSRDAFLERWVEVVDGITESNTGRTR